MAKSSTEIEGSGVADTWIFIDRKARNCLYFLPVALIVDSIAQFMMPPLYPALALRAHVTEDQTALIFSLRGLLATLFTIPCGYLITFFGHRPLLIFSFLNCAAASCLTAVASSWQPLTAASALFGISACVVRVSCFSYVADLFTSGVALKGGDVGKPLPREPPDYDMDGYDRRNTSHDQEVVATNDSDHKLRTNQDAPCGARQVSFTGQAGVMLGAVSFGGFLGPIVGAPIYEYVGAWAPYSIIGALALVLVLVVSLTSIIPSPTTGLGYNRLDAPSAIGEGEVEAGRGEEISRPSNTNIWSIVKTVVLNRKMLAPFVVVLVQSGAWAVLEVVVPFFMADTCGLSTSSTGIAFGLNNLTYVVVASLAAPIVLFLGPRLMVILGLLIIVIGYPLLVLGKGSISCHVVFQFGINSLVGFGFALLECPLYPSLVSASGIDKISNHALLFSLYSVNYSLGYFLGQIGVAGLIAVRLSPLAIMGISSGACLAVTLLWWRAMRL